MRTHPITQSFYRENRFNSMLSRNKVLRLQFFAGARRKAHTKMGEALVPRARHTHLLGTILRREFSNWVQVASRALCTKKVRGRFKCYSWLDSALDPNLVNALFLPICKQAHTVRAGLNLIEMIFQRAERQVLVNILAHREGGLNLKCDLCDHT